MKLDLDIKSRFNAGLYIIGAAVVCAVAAVILYITTGVTAFTPKLEPTVIIFNIIGIVLAVGFGLFDSKMGKYAAYIFFLLSFLKFIAANITYIANIFVAIDGTSFSFTFILTTVFLLASWILALVSAAKSKEEW